MQENWNPKVEHIEGRLCEKGLMKERYDDKVDDLVRNLTSEGKKTAEELLKDPKWRKAYLLLAYNEFRKYPIEIRRTLWKRLINQLKNIKEK